MNESDSAVGFSNSAFLLWKGAPSTRSIEESERLDVYPGITGLPEARSW